MNPITDAERLAWQRQAHALLGKLLERAAKEGLPPAVNWTVRSAAGGLHGECLTLDGDRRADFTAWRDALGTPDEEHERPSEGNTRLTAVWERMDGVQVTLTATIWDEPADGEGEADDQG